MRAWPPLLLALTLAAAAPGVAQTRPPGAPPRWTWFLNASVGLVAREIATWNPTHDALDPTGWDSYFQVGCVNLCQSASDVVEGRVPAPMVSVRRQLGHPWQARVMGALASPGYYPGAYNGIPLEVRPTTATFALQAVMPLKAFWFAAGPSYYAGRLTTTAGPSSYTERRSGVGFVLTGAATFPRASNLFGEVMIERRFAGSVTGPVLTVPGAPDVPPLTVPLSATVLSVGVGWRL